MKNIAEEIFRRLQMDPAVRKANERKRFIEGLNWYRRGQQYCTVDKGEFDGQWDVDVNPWDKEVLITVQKPRDKGLWQDFLAESDDVTKNLPNWMLLQRFEQWLVEKGAM